MDHGDAQARGLEDGAGGDGASIDGNQAGVWAFQSDENLEECALPGAVFPDDAVDFPGMEPEGDAVQGAHGPEALDETGRGEQRGG